MGLKTGTASVQACGKYPGVVEDEKVIGSEKIGKFAEVGVVELATGGKKVKHAGAGTVKKGFLSDQFRRKFVIEIGDEHVTRL